jgi:hypothetical protein
MTRQALDHLMKFDTKRRSRSRVKEVLDTPEALERENLRLRRNAILLKDVLELGGLFLGIPTA